jgi:uncharacterized cupredoxin-like copper-binding protein
MLLVSFNDIETMNMQFHIQHLSTLAKYSGISFIAGTVNHGFFSETRSFFTATLGVVFYIIGCMLERRYSPGPAQSWRELLGVGILASIGFGFFTGGLQHFPDSPERSVWVVPLGFGLSVLALWWSTEQPEESTRYMWWYSGIASITVIAGAVSGWMWLRGDLHNDHQHDHSHNVSPMLQQTFALPNAPSTPIVANGVIREVRIQLDDQMRFIPQRWQAKVGERLRLIVVNNGRVRHELVLGQAEELAKHAREMQAGQAHHHDNAVSVEPGQRGELLWTFNRPGAWEMACFELGHYAAGMKGAIEVLP